MAAGGHACALPGWPCIKAWSGKRCRLQPPRSTGPQAAGDQGRAALTGLLESVQGLYPAAAVSRVLPMLLQTLPLQSQGGRVKEMPLRAAAKQFLPVS